MNCLLIRLPSKKWDSGKLPLEELYVGSAIERCGHNVHILDLQGKDNGILEFDSGNYSCIDASIIANNPGIILLSGTYGAYKRAKSLSRYMRNLYPDIIQAVSPGLLACTYRYLLENSNIDFVMHGDVEIILPVLLESISGKQYYTKIPGISFVNGHHLVKNSDAELISDLDDIPIPNYNLINVNDYYESIQARLESYSVLLEDYKLKDEYQQILRGKEKLLWIIPSRGCTNNCGFCYQSYKGIRRHSVDYVVNYIKYLVKEYNVDGIAFGGNVFNSNQEWVEKFCEALTREKLDIVYHIAAARIDKMNDQLLGKLKDTGCFSIIYGQESGSDKILKEYRKGVSAKQNLQITMMTVYKYRILSPVQIVIGSPGENGDTIRETIEFLKTLKGRLYSLNYLMPLPETMIWDYVVRNNLIHDIDNYLDILDDHLGRPIVNLTKASCLKWKRWTYRIQAEMKLDSLRKGRMAKYILFKIYYEMFITVRPLVSDQKVLFFKKLIAHLMQNFSNRDRRQYGR